MRLVAIHRRPGFRSLSLLGSYGSRIGECGSGVWADKQGSLYEFSLLGRVNFRGKSVYHLLIDSSIAMFNVTGQDGTVDEAPIYGRFNTYLDDRLRLIVPVTPNARFQLRWLDNWVKSHGSFMDVDMTYGAMTANFKINVTTVQGALERL